MNTGLSTWAAYSKSDTVRKKSSSGGLFYELAQKVLDEGGVVYGVSLSDDNRNAEYIRVSSIRELDHILGSKYLQAKLGNTFKNIRDDLDANVFVLFSGTGCYINGLKKYLDTDYDQLICVDVICHGVPSPALWGNYIGNVESKYNDRIRSVNFRCKDIEWERYGISQMFESAGYRFCEVSEDPYMRMFLENLSLRPSCYECTIKTNRYADISLGDFWGIDDIAPEMNDHKGTSLVIERTERGKRLIDRIDDSIVRSKVDYIEAIRSNTAEVESVARPIRRESFFVDFNRMTFDELSQKYIRFSVKQRIKRMIRRVLKKNEC